MRARDDKTSQSCLLGRALINPPSSALPPKADICGALADVCFVPEAENVIFNSKSPMR